MKQKKPDFEAVRRKAFADLNGTTPAASEQTPKPAQKPAPKTASTRPNFETARRKAFADLNGTKNPA